MGRNILLLLLNVPVVRAASSSSASFTRSSRTGNLPLTGLHNRQFHRRFDKPLPTDRSQSIDAPSVDSYNDKILERLRGGAISVGGNRHTNKDSTKPAPKNNSSTNRAVKFVSLATVVIIATMLLILNMDTLKSFVDRDAIIQRLNYVKSKKYGLLFYTCGFVCWEVCGIPTAVVETAAGVVFGFRHGLTSSFIGKTCGSIVAFTLGRTLLSNSARKAMENNASFELIQRGFAKNPLLGAFVVRYSPFPQLIKNYALSMTKLSYPIFILAVIVHGFPFSFLWAAVGNDANLRLRTLEMGETMAANAVLNWSVIFVFIFGFVISPSVTGWWLADLRQEKVG